MRKFLRFISTLLILVVAGFAVIKIPFVPFLNKIVSAPVLWIAAKSKKNLTELETLKEELSQLQADRLLNDELKKENDRLKSLLELKKRTEYKARSAAVIGRDPNHWTRAILINKGTRNGIGLNMPVLNQDGLVGFISEVFPASSKVQLINNYNSRVGALIGKTREAGILKGMGEKGCLLDYLSRETEINEGDVVLTSGMGTLYPKGLPIGKVEDTDFHNGGLVRSVRVRPFAPLNKLEEVLVLELSSESD